VDSSEVLNGFAQQRGLDAHLSPLQALPFGERHFDALVAQAALHHETEWNTIFCEARRVAKPGARLVVGEVAEGSPVAGFLDVFVDRHNPLGHSGRFANDAFVDAIRDAGWTISADFQREYFWRCASRPALHAFLSQLFYMPELDEATLIEGIREHLGGLRESPDGVCMPWGMRVIVAHNPT
jgi:SAM-dependent methyltransferase